MNSFVVLTTLLALAASAPLTNVHVEQATDGSYSFHYMGADSSRLEERKPDGSVAGYYTFLDTDGAAHTVHYTAGPQGFGAVGADVPVPVPEAPEVAAARLRHDLVRADVAAALPPLGADGLVPEVEPVPLSREQFLAAVAGVLGKTRLSFSAETAEVIEAKRAFFEAQKRALGF